MADPTARAFYGHSDRIAVLELHGALRYMSAQALPTFVDRGLASDDADALVVDLTSTSFIDSTGLCLIARICLRDFAPSRPEPRASAVADVARHATLGADVRERALPLLEKALRHDDHPAVRSAAAVALGDLHAEEALPALLLAIEDAGIHVRQMA